MSKEKKNISNKHAIFSQRCITTEGVKAATVFIENGKITAIKTGKVIPENSPFQDVGNAVLMAGVIDAHVHINEPGRTNWEGFDTATHAAAVGGVTSLIEMPLNASPVTTNVAAFQEKIAATKDKLHVHCGFWGGLIPESQQDLEALLQAGVLGIKVFLTHSGIDEFPNVSEADLHKAMPLIAKHGLPLLAHCELDKPHAAQELLVKKPTNYQAYLASRPKSWENEAVALMINLCKKYNCKTHIVHISSAEALPMMQAAKKQQLPLTVETCSHYLYFSSEVIPNAATAYKCAPPIREKSNQLLLWQALEDGLIDFISSDHSPAPPNIKELESGNLAKAWGGIASLQFTLPIVWTAAKKRGWSLEKIAQCLCENPANFSGLGQQKGKIAIGYDADLIVWQPEKSFILQEKNIQHRHKITPYLGEELYGIVQQTYLKGQQIVTNGRLVTRAKGRVILKE